MKNFRVSIRSLLFITALLAVAIGWLADRQRFHNQLRKAADRDLTQRQEIWQMGRKIEQLEANAAPQPDNSWRFQGGEINR